jgi:uncharacterized membrane protein YbhN (UPF0104 family)
VIGLIFPKKKDKMETSLTTMFFHYRQSFKEFRNQLIPMIKVTIFSLMSQFSLLALPFFIMASFSSSLFELSQIEFSLVNITMMMAISDAIFGIVPTLGGAGVAEFTFATVFSIFLKGNYLLWAILLWRFMLFYIWLLIGAGISLYLALFEKNKNNHS